MFDQNRRWPYDADRTYHGTHNDASDDADQWFRLVVELSEYGPTQRKSSYQLRQLKPPRGTGFGWGYNGGGTSRTAEAILRDALDLDQSEKLSVEMREDFCEDVVAHFTDEFLIRRGAVVRWVRGWAAGRNDIDLPAVVTNPPPVSQYAYQDRPPSVRAAQDRLRNR